MEADLGRGSHGADARAELLALAAARIDAALPDRALLYGSSPPEARDLDLVVTPQGEAAAAAALGDAGFSRRGSTWARFDGCAVGVVELLAATSLPLPARVIQAVLDEGAALPGLQRIVVPASHHELLLLAVRLRRSARLEPKHRRRLARALLADPRAWESASLVADGACAGDVSRLRRLAHANGDRRRLRLPPRPRPPRVLVVCSPEVDRAAFHARMLADAIHALGYDAEVVPPGRRVALRSWVAVLRRVTSGGAIVAAAVSERPPRFMPPAVARFVVATGLRGERRVTYIEPSLPQATACEQIAEAAWRDLSSRGRLRSALSRTTRRARWRADRGPRSAG